MRHIAAILGVGLVASGTGCATPRTTIAVGAAAVLTSAALIATRPDSSCHDVDDDGCWVDSIVTGFANGFVTLLAGGLGLGGVGLLASGSISLYEEHHVKPLVPAEMKLLPSGAASAAELGANPTLVTGHERLALQIRLAARANRCPAAEVMRQKLRELDAPLARDLTADPFVAHCVTASHPTARLE